MIIVKFITNQREVCAAIYITPEITLVFLVEERLTATIRDIFSRQQHAANTNPYSHEIDYSGYVKIRRFYSFSNPGESMKALSETVRFLVRLLVVWIVDTLSIFITALIIPGITLGGANTGENLVISAAAALVLGLVNLLLRPIILLLSLWNFLRGLWHRISRECNYTAAYRIYTFRSFR